MNWGPAISFLDSSVVTILGGVSATFIPQDNSGAKLITGLIKTPSMEEEYLPGSNPGTSTIRFWIKIASLSPIPSMGDVLVFNGISYVIQVPPDVDSQGGTTLKLRVT